MEIVEHLRHLARTHIVKHLTGYHRLQRPINVVAISTWSCCPQMASNPQGLHSSSDLADLKARLDAIVLHENTSETPRLLLQGIIKDFTDLLLKIELGEREWRDAFDAVKDPIFSHDDHFRIIRANKAYARQAGMPIQAVIGKPYWKIFPKVDAPLPHCHQNLDKCGEALIDEVTTSDGRIYLSRGFAVRDTNGNYRYSVHILEDISEQRRLQQEAEESMQRYRSLFESAPDAVLLADAQTGQLLDANPAAERLTGRSRAELITLHQSELHPPNSIAQRDFLEHVEEGKTGHWHPPTEVPVLSASGCVIPVEITSCVFRLGERQVIQGIFRDISQRKHAEDKLNEASTKLSLSVHLLEGIIESVPIRVFWKDQDLRYLGCNALFAKDTGLAKPDELIGKTDLDMGWKGQAELYREDDRRIMDSGIPKLGYEEPQTTPDGLIIWLRTSKVPLHNDAGDVTGILGIYDDITQQKQAEQDLQLSEGRLKEAQAVAHLGSWELDLVKNNLWWSDENCRIFGVEPGVCNTYETFLETVHPDDREFVNKSYRDSVQNKTSFDIEHRLLLRDGTVKWVNERCKNLYDDNGIPLRSVGTTLDITERKHTEAKLAHLGRLLDDSINEFYVFDADTFRFVLVNESARRNLGYSMAEMSKLTPLDVAPELNLESFETLIAPLHQDENKVQVIETLQRRKDGSLYPVEVHLQLLAKEVPPVFVATVLDISELRKVDERVRRSESGLAEAQRIAQLGNWEFDVLHKHVFWSDEIYRILEVDPGKSDASYETFLSRVHPDDREQLERSYRESIVNKTPCSLTHRLLMPDGRIKYVRVICETHYSEDDQPLRYVGTVQDITEQHLTGQALNRSNRALKTISSCNSVLIHANDETELLNNMCRVIIDTGGYRFTWIGFVEDGEAKRVQPIAHWGYENGYLEHIDITYKDDEHGRGPAGCAVRHGEPQVVHDILTDPNFRPWREPAIERGYRSVLALPLKNTSGDVFAVLTIYAGEPDAFDSDALSLMQELASDLAFGILALRTRQERDHYLLAHQKSDERFKQVLVETIHAISLTVEKRDPYTAGHQYKVAQISVAIGRELGMNEDSLEGLRLGAMIHDIGKIYVPAEILNRPGRLSKAEFEIIKSHSEVGYDIIKDVQFPWPVGKMVLQHHERLDGSGYPMGLKGEEIILEARILAVADVVEAITAHRPYRPGLGLDKALMEIESNRGTLYDPKVADACLHLMRDKGFSFEENSHA